MHQHFFMLIFALGLLGTAHAGNIVQDNFSEDAADPIHMSAYHAGNSMQALCSPAPIDGPDDPCPIILKNKTGGHMILRGLDSDEANTAEITWYGERFVEIDISTSASDDTYNILIDLTNMKMWFFTGFLSVDDKTGNIAIQNKTQQDEFIVTNIYDQTKGFFVPRPTDAVSGNPSVYYEGVEFHDNGLTLTYYTSVKTVTKKTIVIPINPSQFVPINPSDIGTFDIKTLNANSANS